MIIKDAREMSGTHQLEEEAAISQVTYQTLREARTKIDNLNKLEWRNY